MKRILLAITLLFAVLIQVEAQDINNAFFQKVSYVGAFDGVNDWTEGWTNWDPVNAAYGTPAVTKGNGQFTRTGGVHITTDETWSGVVKLDGWVYVDAGATLTIEPGTVIRATNKSVLSVERGGKIMAAGTKAQPIVFTSLQGAGFRANSDWGGLVINGNGINNLPGGTGVAEGGIGSEYGGNDNGDNSGVLTYVRIEFPGYEVATGSEVNGLTLNSVGSGTLIDYIQVSYSGDDGFEWFGGAVNVKHIISYRTEDDDFDTDNGYSGMVQFGLILRDPSIVDTDTANAFESDNNSSGTELTPVTKAIFSNISAFGASKDQATWTGNPQNHKDGAAMRIRRASRLSIYNSLFLGWGKGVRLESSFTHNAAVSDELAVKNTILGGIYGKKYGDASVMTEAEVESWFLAAARKNRMLGSDSEAKIADPFNLEAPKFQPQAGSPLFNASFWVTTPATEVRNGAGAGLRNYPNPFSGTTTVEVTTPRVSKATLAVYSLSGAMIRVLHSGALSDGNHRFSFDAGHLPGGIYVVRFVTESDSQSLKISLR
ncbi:MAG TPA: T9SS type A sorting domain-containing protein [Prolixibacteraceae bacterium]|nr:T9SS type A sorting domain-containing protein [Prolixibacteraceae bacterium]